MCSSGSRARCAPAKTSGFELDAVGQRTEEQVVIDEVALVGIKVGTEPALVAHNAQFTDDPV